MMLGLPAEIGLDASHMGIAYRERAVTDLPGESGQARERLMNPAGGICFHDAQRLCDRDLLVERDEKMHVIRHTVRCPQGAALGPENAADVVEEPRLDVLRDERSTVLCGEDQVMMEASERLGHGAYSLTGKPAALAGLGKICLSPDLYQGLSPPGYGPSPLGAGSGNTPAQSILSQYGGGILP